MLSDFIRSRSSNISAPETAGFDVFFGRLDVGSSAVVGGMWDIVVAVNFFDFSRARVMSDDAGLSLQLMALLLELLAVGPV